MITVILGIYIKTNYSLFLLTHYLLGFIFNTRKDPEIKMVGLLLFNGPTKICPSRIKELFQFNFVHEILLEYT
jgi:hypothetical protein